jgi:GTP-binding protein Era
VRSGFATLVGRTNVGKSTLLNRMVGTKVSIVSARPNTTRHAIQGVLNRPDAQLVLVDTPGLHRPRTLLGRHLNQAAADATAHVDVALLVLDATAPVGPGDRRAASEAGEGAFVAVNKIDAARPAQVLAQLDAAAGLGLGEGAEYFPVSAKTGEGIDELIESMLARLPEGPRYFPEGVVSDLPDAFLVAELVREQLLAQVRDELPHSVACEVTEWDWPRIRCEVLVERESQKGIVIGKGGSVLKAVGTAVRAQLPPGAYLELFVKVDRDWQQRPAALARLGL